MKVDPTLGPQFFDRDAKRVARELIGCYLVCRRNSNLLKHKITKPRPMRAHTTLLATHPKAEPSELKRCLVRLAHFWGRMFAPEHRMSGSPHFGMPISG